jgi:hypothetical protein
MRFRGTAGALQGWKGGEVNLFEHGVERFGLVGELVGGVGAEQVLMWARRYGDSALEQPGMLHPELEPLICPLPLSGFGLTRSGPGPTPPAAAVARNPYACSSMRWKCPKPDCPPTDFPPVEVTSSGDDVRMSVCGGECGQTYPATAFKRVP